jgi:hypothetical protein
MERLHESPENKAAPSLQPKEPPKIVRTPTLRPPSFHQSTEDGKPRIQTMHGVPLHKMIKSASSANSATQSRADSKLEAVCDVEDQAETVTAKKGSPMATQLRDAMLNASLQPGFGTPNPSATSRFQQTISFVRHDETSPVSPLLAGPPEALATTEAAPDAPPKFALPPTQKEPQTIDVLPPVNQQGALISAPAAAEYIAPKPVERRRKSLGRATKKHTHHALGTIAIIACFLVGAAIGILVGVLHNP